MPYDDDLAWGGSHDLIPMPDPPMNMVPVSDDKRAAIRAFAATYPRLGAYAVLSGVRRSIPGTSLDDVRTVLAEADR